MVAAASCYRRASWQQSWGDGSGLRKWTAPDTEKPESSQGSPLSTAVTRSTQPRQCWRQVSECPWAAQPKPRLAPGKELKMAFNRCSPFTLSLRGSDGKNKRNRPNPGVQSVSRRPIVLPRELFFLLSYRPSWGHRDCCLNCISTQTAFYFF